MSHVGETFFTSIGCMDGRVHQAILDYGQNKFGVKYADTITEAGLVGQVIKKDADPKLLESIKNKILISLSKHLSKGIVVHGHSECAGNPVEDNQHREETKEATKLVRNMVGAMSIEVIPVFVVRDGEGWKVEEI
jgi:carbonic anhydrase